MERGRLFEFCGRLCHQDPARSFFVRGRQLPLCARCTGVIAGYAAGAALFAFGLCAPPIYCALALLPVIVDWSAQTFFALESTNLRRLATGALGGWGFMTLALLCLRLGFELLS